VADPGCVWCSRPEAEHAPEAPVVGKPEKLGRLCAGTTSQYFAAPKASPHAVLAEYAPLLEKLNAFERLAGEFLVRSLETAETEPEPRPDWGPTESNRALAMEYATKALETRRAMKAWRLAHGYER
jgi:hypothetical protein